MEATIKDIARLAKVSHTTVCRALHNSPSIKAETKNRIMKIVKEVNYFPNYSARNLVLHKSNTIGLFFSSIKQGTSPSFFYETVRGVSSSIEKNYNLIIQGIDTYNDFSLINKKRFDGIVLMSQSEQDNAFIHHVLHNHIPLVVLNREIEESSVLNILSDDSGGAFKAVEYLIENGHTDIAFIEGKEDFKSSKERKDGYKKAFAKHNIPLNNEYVIKGDYSMRSGYEAMKKLINLHHPPTAVFCSNDDMAIGAIRAAFESELSIPGNISILGFDDIGFSEYATPALTTVKRPMEEISIIGGRKISEIINGLGSQCGKIYIKTELVKRNSVTRLIT